MLSGPIRWRSAIFGLVLLFSGTLSVGVATAAEDVWHENRDGEIVVNLYFVYTSTCPHCLRAIPFLENLDEARPWLRIWWLQADLGNPEVERVALAVAGEIGEPILGVPTFMFCGEMVTGYDQPEGTGATLIAGLDACYARYVQDTPVAVTTTTTPVEVTVPIVGDVAVSTLPLPVFTVIIAGLDAFNPCAFFVLLFLLSLLTRMQNRARMALVGFTFVAISGILYFVFMAAWLNLFLVTGHLAWVTTVAGAVAVALALLNLKEYVRPGSRGSLSISESAKPKLYHRVRNIIAGDKILPILGATVVLAVVVNMYELLCTVGLPMVYTRILTLSDLSTSAYFGYLILYNVIYVIPLFVIVTAFVWTLGSRKLQPHEGRALKLLSGTMMLGLGLVLLTAPGLLQQIGVAVGILAAAVFITTIVTLVERRMKRA